MPAGRFLFVSFCSQNAQLNSLFYAVQAKIINIRDLGKMVMIFIYITIRSVYGKG
jgi:hypothetical protein